MCLSGFWGGRKEAGEPPSIRHVPLPVFQISLFLRARPLQHRDGPAGWGRGRKGRVAERRRTEGVLAILAVSEAAAAGCQAEYKRPGRSLMIACPGWSKRVH